MLLLLACSTPAVDSKPIDGETAECNADLAAAEGLVRASTGAYQGLLVGDTRAWLGIPYAAPPVGDLRFAPTEPHECVEGVTDAASFGPVCPQWDTERTEILGEEDCLQLNVWAPTDAAGAPVLVFLHGGANVAGSTSDVVNDVSLYDGAELAARTGSVVVTAAYRLGALGFLAHPALVASDGKVGNWGLLDQIEALRWVQANIAGFGGDPARVLLFGESAGAADTCALYTAPSAAGLFSAALMESGACSGTPVADAEDVGEDKAADLGCTGDDAAACLRALDVADIAALSDDPISDLGVPGLGDFGPTIDGVLLPDDPSATLAAGGQNDVPFVIGSNAQETSQWVPTMTDEEYEALVKSVAGFWADEILALYPVEDFESARFAWIEVTTDASFTCPTRRIARAAATSQASLVWRYFFTRVPNGASGRLYGAWHGLELVYVFQHVDATVEATGYAAEDADYSIEAAMGAAWASLAASGTPDATSLPEPWPAYDPETDPYLEIGDNIVAGEGVRTERCDFWDEIAG